MSEADRTFPPPADPALRLLHAELWQKWRVTQDWIMSRSDARTGTAFASSLGRGRRRFAQEVLWALEMVRACDTLLAARQSLSSGGVDTQRPAWLPMRDDLLKVQDSFDAYGWEPARKRCQRSRRRSRHSRRSIGSNDFLEKFWSLTCAQVALFDRQTWLEWAC